MISLSLGRKNHQEGDQQDRALFSRETSHKYQISFKQLAKDLNFCG